MAELILDSSVNVNERLATIFSRVLYKTNFGNKKGTQGVLSLDLLKNDKKKELLTIATTRLEKTYTTILSDKNPQQTINEKSERLFLYLIKGTCEDFLTKQYGYKIHVPMYQVKKLLYTKSLLQDKEILFQTPFNSILDPESPTFTKLYSPIYSSASNTLIEALIDNLIIEISNCTIYFLMTKWSSIYALRQTLYKVKFLSLRNFERFRNNLVWQLNVKTYIERPIELYNNSFNIYVLRVNGIYRRKIFANRSNDINLLKNLPLLTILLVEIRDFLVSRFDELIYFVSKGVRFTFTSVLGQFLGLIWRGIIEGLKK